MAPAVRAILTMLMVTSSAQAGRTLRHVQAQATRLDNQVSVRPREAVAALLLMANPAASFKPGMSQPVGRALGNFGVAAVSKAIPQVSARARDVSMSGDEESDKNTAKNAKEMATRKEQFAKVMEKLNGMKKKSVDQEDAFFWTDQFDQEDWIDRPAQGPQKTKKTAQGPQKTKKLDQEDSAAQPLVQHLASDEKKFKEFCYGLPGSTAPLGEFDPAGFTNGASKADVYRLREAELTHGRVGMLAAAGFLVQESFHPLFSGVNGPAINQIPQLPPALWFGMTLGIGICESVRVKKGWADPFENNENFQKLKEDYYPGDLGFDPLGLKPDDPKELHELQNKELNNGRLGMLAAAGFLAQEAVTGTTWGPSLAGIAG